MEKKSYLCSEDQSKSSKNNHATSTSEDGEQLDNQESYEECNNHTPGDSDTDSSFTDLEMDNRDDFSDDSDYEDTIDKKKLNRKWKLGNGKRRMKKEKSKMENREWIMKNRKWKMENETWKMEDGESGLDNAERKMENGE
nr:unnamed protein product [Callosobruchus analis]